MPPKNTRLTRPQFLGAFTKGRRVRTPLFELIAARSENLRYAVVVSKKAAPSAVMRNSLRRRVYHRLREIFREQSAHGEFIFIMKAAVRDVSAATLTEEIKNALGASLSNNKKR